MRERTQFELCPQCGGNGVIPIRENGKRVGQEWCPMCDGRGERVVFPQPAPAAPEAPPCLHPSLSYQGNGVYTCAECGQHGSESFLEQESARRQSQAGLARAEYELAALQAENQRLREALRNIGNTLGRPVPACYSHEMQRDGMAANIPDTFKLVEAALAEKGSK